MTSITSAGSPCGSLEESMMESNTLLPSTANQSSTAVSLHSTPSCGWGRKSLALLGASVVLAMITALYRKQTLLPVVDSLEHSEDEQEIFILDSEGKKHDKHKESLTACEDGQYSKRTLQMAYEIPFISLFNDNKGMRKHEASDVIVVGDYAYSVCDSSWSVCKFNRKLDPFGVKNVMIGDPQREEEDSGYEAIFHDDGFFYVVRESVENKDKTYHAIIEKLQLGETDYDVVEVCSSEIEFEGDSKGFEGVLGVRNLNNELVVLALCEGNYCSEERKFEVGNGRLIAMRHETNEDGSCVWKTIRTIKFPTHVKFRDFSSISLDQSGQVAVSTQEDSQLWIGKLVGQNEQGLWDIDNMEFDENVGTVYDFPKNDACQTVYCNVEGIHWLNGDMLIAVSDKMKSKGKQDYRCFDKDQSVHVFVLP